MNAVSVTVVLILSVAIMVMGFVLWRSYKKTRQYEAQIKKMENDISEIQQSIDVFLQVFRAVSMTDDKVGQVLKRFKLF